MSLALYDQAIMDKLKSWSVDTNLHIIRADDTQQLFQLIADEGGDKSIQLPIISIKRIGGYNLINTERTRLSANGLTYRANTERSLWLNAIPIQIEYQIDVYTRYMDEADEYMRNIIFNVVNYPRLTITIPYYDENIKHDSSIHLDSTIADNSSVPERLIAGQFTRLSCKISVADAYLWDIRIKDNYHIDADVVAYPNNTREIRHTMMAKKIRISKKFKLTKHYIGEKNNKGEENK